MPGVAVVVGNREVVSRINRLPADAGRALAAAGPDIARFGQSEVRRHASGGRPGPDVITGAFLDSIIGESTARGQQTLVIIGSNAPQAARLEFGFFGYDSLGRFYQQPPYPSFGPAVPAIADYAANAVITQLRRML